MMFLRVLARLLIRGGSASYIRDDLEELFQRDLARGTSRGRALWRCWTNLLGSAAITWRARPRAARDGGFSALDFKLGFRMLVKYPGLTLVGGLAIAFALCIGAGTFELLTQVFQPRLPLPDGDRIVGLRLWHLPSTGVEEQALFDFALWRDELDSVEDLGAFRLVQRNLIAADGAGEPVNAAEISATAFRVAGVPPLLGRPLVDEDERPGAPPVVVIGHDVWRSRLSGDPGVIGRTVRLGNAQAMVVGVMPGGFAFPIAQSLWTPLRVDASTVGRRQGPQIHVFGRLAPGVSLDAAEAELTALGRAVSAEFPDTHEHLRPQILPYAHSVLSMSVGISHDELDLAGLAALLRTTLNLPLVLFLVLVCGNVALLMFARAATRESEIIVRSALGASRRRIILQLFAEALVLGAFAAVIGLAAAGSVVRWGLWTVETQALDGGRLPFWFRGSLSSGTVLYACLLTVLGAAIAGIAPALKVTRGVGVSLRQATAGGGGFRFGGLWTAVIVSQIAVTVPFPLFVWAMRVEAAAIRAVDVGFPESEYLSVRLRMDRETARPISSDTSAAAFAANFTVQLQELERRLEAEPAVTGVTFADRLPRMYHDWKLIEVDEGGAAPLDPRWHAYRISSATVGADYFDVLGVPILAGRGFHSGDLADDDRPVIVNQSFVERVLGGRNPLGRRLRYVPYARDERRTEEDEPWYRIVGVVRDLGMAYGTNDPKVAGFYHPAAGGGSLEGIAPRMVLHVGGDAVSFAPRLRGIAAAVDPALRLDRIMPLDRIVDAELQFYRFWTWLLLLGTAIALLLSLAGIYAVMSFTVAQRTREIGIRVALGADRRRVFAEIFRRPLAQVGFGILAGGGLLAVMLFGGGVTLSLVNVAVLVAYVAIMAAVCMLASVVPTRRALAVEPGTALRSDG